MSLKEDQIIREVVHAQADKLVTVGATEWAIINIDTLKDYAWINEMINKLK